jgi:pyruvate/2-oxoglutarate dehydrogenase complex dihydrolipoamide dehydrogenase (E3) component
VREDFDDEVRVMLNSNVASTRAANGRVTLTVDQGDGRSTEVSADHLIAATGYYVDVDRIGVLDREIVDALRLADRAPALDTAFESSVPGLYFTGPVATNSFGPLLRFACGSEFATRRIASRVGAIASRQSHT